MEVGSEPGPAAITRESPINLVNLLPGGGTWTPGIRKWGHHTNISGQEEYISEFNAN
jgi:hypothetical protein